MTDDSKGPDVEVAPRPPCKWFCARAPGHDGPCDMAGNGGVELVVGAVEETLRRFPQWQAPAPGVRAKRHGDHDLPVPTYKTPGAAGMDLHARLQYPIHLRPKGRLVVCCGFAFEIPPGWEGQVRPRSGLAKDYGLVCAPGTIDSDYRGEVGMNLFNLGEETVTINHGDRVAQLVIAPAPQARIVLVDELSVTERGEGGFGSTGKR